LQVAAAKRSNPDLAPDRFASLAITTLRLHPLDVGPDCLACVIDPAAQSRLVDRVGEILLPGRIVPDAGPAAQRVLRYPGGIGAGQFRLAGDCFTDIVKSVTAACDDEFEGVKILPVFRGEFTGRGEF